MFTGHRLPAKDRGEHEVAHVFVVDARVKIKQRSGSARRDKDIVELPVVSPERLLAGSIAGGYLSVHRRELVMRGHDACLPLDVAGRERATDSVAFEQLSQMRDLLQVLAGNGRHFE